MKFEDLAPAVAELKAGRSFGNGKQMFTVGNCIAWHKLENVGAEFGPDLTKFEPKSGSPVNSESSFFGRRPRTV